MEARGEGLLTNLEESAVSLGLRDSELAYIPINSLDSRDGLTEILCIGKRVLKGIYK